MATLQTEFASGQCKYLNVGDVVYASKYTMTTTASATDVVQLCKVQAGARVLTINVATDATATISYSVGDGDDTGKFLTTASAILTASLTASTVSTPIRSLNVAAGIGYSYSVADTIDLRFDAAGGKTAGNIYYVVKVSYDQQQQY